MKNSSRKSSHPNPSKNGNSLKMLNLKVIEFKPAAILYSLEMEGSSFHWSYFYQNLLNKVSLNIAVLTLNNSNLSP